MSEKVPLDLGKDYAVKFAMRYQNPSINSVLEEFKKEGIDNIKVIPLYPQYAEATTGSTIDEVNRVVSKWKNPPKLKFIKQFFDNPQLIEVIASKASKWMNKAEYYHFLFSYHGLPESQIEKSSVDGCCKLDEKCCSQINKDNQYCM